MVIGKWNLMAISPLLMNSLIFSVAAVVLSSILLPAKGIRNVFTLTRKGWLWVGLFAGSSVFALWAFWAGVQKMDPSLAAFLNRVEVFIAILLGIIFLKERFTRWETLGALLSVAGILVMRLTLRVEYSEGFWLVLLGSLFFGITEFISKIAVRHVEPTVLTCIRAAFMAVVLWQLKLASPLKKSLQLKKGSLTAWLSVWQKKTTKTTKLNSFSKHYHYEYVTGQSQ